MALFNYTTIDASGNQQTGSIEAVNRDVAISSLQRRGLVILSIEDVEKKSFWEMDIGIFNRVSNKEIVFLSRQIATLFQAQVSALKIFRLLAGEAENKVLQRKLTEISDDLQGGTSIAKSLEKHPEVFSSFYVNMVKAGEESGQLDQTFESLAEYLDRNYELTSKAKNALIYPIFVIFTFVVVMILMLTMVIPKISAILIESGGEIPFYTQVVINLSEFLVNYGLFLLVLLVIGGFFVWRFAKDRGGKLYLAKLKLNFPYVGTLYRKLYLSRLADNMHTMLLSGIPMVRAVEVTATVVDNVIFEDILLQVATAIKGGRSVADSLSEHPDIPGIMIQMVRVGEETGELNSILKTLSNFYRREVTNAVDTLVGLIEPVMIVLLGAGVGLLLASVLLPIYNVSSSF